VICPPPPNSHYIQANVYIPCVKSASGSSLWSACLHKTFTTIQCTSKLMCRYLVLNLLAFRLWFVCPPPPNSHKLTCMCIPCVKSASGSGLPASTQQSLHPSSRIQYIPCVKSASGSGLWSACLLQQSLLCVHPSSCVPTLC